MDMFTKLKSLFYLCEVDGEIMSSLEIDEIIAAEIESEQRINQALVESKEKIKLAHLEALSKLEASKDKLVSKRNQALEAAKVEAELLRQKRLDENRLALSEIKEGAKLKINTAVDLVIERIVK